MMMNFDFAGPAEWADAYRALRLNVIPASGKKHPVARWKEFQEALVPETVYQKWYAPGGEHCQNYHMGFLTGGGCLEDGKALLVIDVDAKDKDGLATWRAWLEVHENGLEPDTWKARTGSGGRHLYFWYSSTIAIHNTQEKFHGIDVRAQGGFIMAPPSPHYILGTSYQWEDGCNPLESAELAEAPAWLIEICRDIGAEDRPTAAPREQVAASSNFDPWGNRTDGREGYMRDVVWRSVVDLYREAPIKPGADELQARMLEAYNVYAANVRTRFPGDNETGLEREGRGLSLFQVKWDVAVRQWGSKVAQAAAVPRPFADGPETPVYVPSGDLYEFLDVQAIKALPDPRGLIKGLAIEQALGFVYGPPGCLKTFICLDMALSFVSGLPEWWGRGIERSGAVVYISSEGQSDLKFRIEAWETKHKKVDNCPFYLIRQTINFMQPADVGRLLATVQEIARLAGKPLAAVFVDTVSRVLPGADENLQKDMTLFVAACDAVRQRFDTIVVGVHHTARAGNMRGSTVFPGAGDFMLEVEREPGARIGIIRAVKIKAAEDGWEQPFAVEEVPLGLGATSSLVVLPADDDAPPRARMQPNERAVLEALKRALDDGGAHPGLGNIPLKARCVRED